MSTYKLTILVDEEELRDTTDDQNSPIESLIEREACWLQGSGITTIKVEEIKS